MRAHFLVDFPADRFVQVQPYDVVVRQKEYAHDVAVLYYRDPGVARRRYRNGAPVVLRWGWAPSSLETFYGYVHSTKLVQRPREPAQLEVYLIGASVPLNKTRMRSHKNLGVVPLIRRIATEHRFTLRNDPSSRFHRHIPQLGRSDFRLMCELARDIGFTLSVKRTEVQFKRRVIDTNPQGRQPTFRYRNGVGPPRGTLYSYTLKAGSAPLAKNRRLVIGGVDANGKRFWARNSKDDCCDADAPSFTEYWKDDAPSSIHEGRALLSGLSNMSRFYVQAEVEVSGSAPMRCGQTMRLLDVSEDMLGYWWIGSVEHRLSGQRPGQPTSYRAKCEVGRETLVQTLCVFETPPTSWSGKPEVPTDEPVLEETPTVYDPADDCAPLEEPEHGRGVCRCPPKRCPGSQLALPRRVRLAPRLDRWSAASASRRLRR